MTVTIKDNPTYEARLFAAMNRGLTDSAIVLADTMVRSFGSNHGGIPSAPGQVPHSQTGGLRNSIGYIEAVNGESGAGTTLAYGRFLEVGAHIRPRNGRAIAIPLSPEAKRLSARHGGRVRSIINALKFDKARPMRWVKTRNGVLLLIAEGRRKNAGWMPFFLLTKHARLAARPWLRPAFLKASARMQEAFIRRVNQEMSA